MPDPIQICRGFTNKQWRELRERLRQDDSDAWERAIAVFQRRITERYINCIESLIDVDSHLDVEVPPEASWNYPLPDDTNKAAVVPGFSIVALCCILADTLQSFREKAKSVQLEEAECKYPDGSCVRPSTTNQFKTFLKRPGFRGAFDDEKVAQSFVSGIRNGIFHEAETRDWVIWRDEPVGSIISTREQGYVLNRSLFYEAIGQEFQRYLDDLRNPTNDKLRPRFVEKMNDLVKEC
ncbi:MAG: hypothetical protein ACREHF_13875 [Rhizomicrobium sp.]